MLASISEERSSPQQELEAPLHEPPAEPEVPEVPPPSPVSSPCVSHLGKACLLLAALAAYTVPPVLVNWSTVPKTPAGFDRRNVAVATPGLTMDSFEDQLFVDSVSDDYPLPEGVAGRVMHGDNLIGAFKGDELLFSENCWSNGEDGGDEFRVALVASLENVKEGVADPWKPLRSLDRENPVDYWTGLKCRTDAEPDSLQFSLANVKVLKADKGPMYNPFTAALMKTLMGVGIMAVASACDSVSWLPIIFSKRMVVLMIAPSTCNVLADVCEIMANAGVSAALYTIVQQTRLIGTAALMYFMLGTKQTQLQISILLSLTLAILVYTNIPQEVMVDEVWSGWGKPVPQGTGHAADASSSGGLSLPMLAGYAKVLLSILGGVLVQRALHDPFMKDKPPYVMMASTFMGEVFCILPLTLAQMYSTGWSYGFLGGAPLIYKHCGQLSDADCAATSPIVTVLQGWDYRTWIMALFYVYRKTAIQLVIKRFDAIVKNLVNAAAPLVTFLLTLLISPNMKFNFAQFGVVMVIVFQIHQYSAAPSPPKDPKPAAELEAKDVEAGKGEK